jgi:hypothetical protein
LRFCNDFFLQDFKKKKKYLHTNLHNNKKIFTIATIIMSTQVTDNVTTDDAIYNSTQDWLSRQVAVKRPREFVDDDTDGVDCCNSLDSYDNTEYNNSDCESSSTEFVANSASDQDSTSDYVYNSESSYYESSDDSGYTTSDESEKSFSDDIESDNNSILAFSI